MQVVYTTAEVAKISKTSENSVRRHIKEGLLKAHKIGQQWRIKQVDLEKYLKGE